jgi:hypothetical protein
MFKHYFLAFSQHDLTNFVLPHQPIKTMQKLFWKSHPTFLVGTCIIDVSICVQDVQAKGNDNYMNAYHNV